MWKPGKHTISTPECLNRQITVRPMYSIFLYVHFNFTSEGTGTPRHSIGSCFSIPYGLIYASQQDCSPLSLCASFVWHTAALLAFSYPTADAWRSNKQQPTAGTLTWDVNANQFLSWIWACRCSAVLADLLLSMCSLLAEHKWFSASSPKHKFPSIYWELKIHGDWETTK